MSISVVNYLDRRTTLNTIHAWQVKISVSHHKTTADKKKRKESVTIKNFGSKLDLGKVKSCSMLELAWRVRPASP